MSSPALEAFLARLYTDEDQRMRFLASPSEVAQELGLSGEECRAAEAIDRDGLILAAQSYARKQARGANSNRSRAKWWRSLLRFGDRLGGKGVPGS